jgi:hypothetical protein
MPMFVTNDQQAKYLSASRPAFRRAVRLHPETRRRLRDILIFQMKTLGCDPEDIAGIFSMPICARQVRNRLKLFSSAMNARTALLDCIRSAQEEAGGGIHGDMATREAVV